VLGHASAANEERGIFRSRDGGQTFERVLYQGPDIGGADIVLDAQNPDVLYAVLLETRQAPWEGAEFRGAGTGVYKSSDGGTTWRAINKGLPLRLDRRARQSQAALRDGRGAAEGRALPIR